MDSPKQNFESSIAFQETNQHPVMDFMSNDHISQNALREAAEAMVMDLGDLKDLPIEFATTLANIYYRFFAYLEHILSGGSSRFLDPYVPQSTNMFDAFKTTTGFKHKHCLLSDTPKILSSLFGRFGWRCLNCFPTW